MFWKCFLFDAHWLVASKLVSGASPPKQQVTGFMMWVCENGSKFVPAAVGVQDVHGEKLCYGKPLCSLNDPLEGLPLFYCGVTKPYCDTSGKGVLQKSSVSLDERPTAQANSRQ